MLTYSDKPGITARLANAYGRLVAKSASDRNVAAIETGRNEASSISLSAHT